MRVRLPPAILSLVLGALVLGACSSAPQPSTPAAKPAPSAPTATPAATPAPSAPSAAASPAAPLAAAEPAVAAAPPADQAFATFYRKKRFVGAILNTSVHVDKLEVADLDPGTYVKVPLAPGSHAFYSDEERDTLKVDVEPGKQYFFRIELQAGLWKGHGVLKRVDEKTGAEEFNTWELKLAKDIRQPKLVVPDPGKP